MQSILYRETKYEGEDDLMKKPIKTIAKLILAFAVVVLVAGCSGEEAGSYTAGSYEGTGEGYGGTITATVTVTEDKITEVTADIPDETEPIAQPAVDEITEAVIENQGIADVEVVSGATASSEGLIEAIEEALQQAEAAE